MIRAIRRNMLKKELGTNKIRRQWENIQDRIHGIKKELRIYKNNGRKAYLKLI